MPPMSLRMRPYAVHTRRMPRRARIVAGDQIYHVINRMNGLGLMFETPACYREFLHLLGEAAEETGMRILAYCVMPNHWHLLVWPREAGDLRRFVQRLTIRHSHRWHVRKGMVGRGSLYQGRYKSFLIQSDEYLLTVCRYVERNPLRARLVESSLAWPWSSAPHRARELGLDGEAQVMALPTGPLVRLEPLPVQLPDDWVRWLDHPQTAAELECIRQHVQTGSPYGDPKWMEAMGQRKSERPVGKRPASESAGRSEEIEERAASPVTGTSKRYK
jgi:putative transposase